MSLNSILATAPLTTSGYHIKANGTTLGNSLIWDNGTNVGIGNTNTSYTLDVSGTGRFTGALTASGTITAGATNGNIRLTGTTDGFIGVNTSTMYLTDWATAAKGLTINLSTGAATFSSTLAVGTTISAQNGGTYAGSAEFAGILRIQGGDGRYFTSGNGLEMSYNSIYSYNRGTNAYNDLGLNDAMTIKGAGNVGIGTSSPDWPLTVKTDASANSIKIIGRTGGDNALAFYGSDASTLYGHIDVGASYFQIYTSNSQPMQFFTGGTERMRITSGGDVFVGFSGSAPGQRLRVQGADSGSANYSLVVANSTTASTFLVRNDGAVQVVGSLSKGSGSFRIDHPLESMTETHQLVHSFIEGPRVDLIYRGKLTLVNGKAQANIDEISTMTEGTFEVLCREVQCFTTNESGWDLVKGKVIGNIIYIESQNPNSTDEISWMVIGERKDKHIMDTDWTDENGKVIVEPLKTNLPTIQSLQEQINILAK